MCGCVHTHIHRHRHIHTSPPHIHTHIRTSVYIHNMYIYICTNLTYSVSKRIANPEQSDNRADPLKKNKESQRLRSDQEASLRDHGVFVPASLPFVLGGYFEVRLADSPRLRIKKSSPLCSCKREFPKLRATYFGVLILRILLFGVLY